MSRSFEKTISPFSEDLETVLGKQVTKSHWHATAYVAAARPNGKAAVRICFTLPGPTIHLIEESAVFESQQNENE